MPPAKQGKRRTKYVHKDPETGLWVIQRTFNNKTYIFGEYRTFRKAREEKNRIEKNGWLETLGERYEGLPKNYFLAYNGKYEVYKNINGKRIRFGYYDTEKEAQERVRELRQKHWKE